MLPWQTTTHFNQNGVKSKGYIVNHAGSACAEEEVLLAMKEAIKSRIVSSEYDSQVLCRPTSE